MSRRCLTKKRASKTPVKSYAQKPTTVGFSHMFGLNLNIVSGNLGNLGNTTIAYCKTNKKTARKIKRKIEEIHLMNRCDQKKSQFQLFTQSQGARRLWGSKHALGFPVRLGEFAQCLGIEGRTREPIVQNKYINLCTSKNMFHSPMLRRARFPQSGRQRKTQLIGQKTTSVATNNT